MSRGSRILLLVLTIVIVVAIVAMIYFGSQNVGPLADVMANLRPEPTLTAAEIAEKEAEPQPTPTPIIELADVVIVTDDVPAGSIIPSILLRVVQRPLTNIAVIAEVTFDDPALVAGRIAKTRISSGQEVLLPMLALSPTDIATMGSDLSLYVDKGKVAVAFPIDKFTGVAFAIRPGDLVDVMMTLRLVDLDEEFQSSLPNLIQRINTAKLEEGQQFLFQEEVEGRTEFLPELNTVFQIAAGGGQRPIPKRVTQLTLQRAEVLWMGTWFNPIKGEAEFVADAFIPTPEPQMAVNGDPDLAVPTPEPTKERPEDRPDLIILSMDSQDALILKWALEVGIDIDLLLRSQGDTSIFLTTSVSLPQLVEQGGMTVPEPLDVGLEPPVNEVPVPAVPAMP